jgi:ribosomal protein S18 acetylase RimI-like enzyme
MSDHFIEVISCDFNDTSHCQALVQLMNEYRCDKMGDGKPYTAEEKVKLVEGLKNHPSRIVILAKQDNKFVGLVNCFINFATFTVKPFINIHDVIVTASARNYGIGRKMLEVIIEKAKAMDCSKVTLEVRADNLNARHLYNSMGFLDANPGESYWTKKL